jgi:hypothetical protein
MSEARFDRVSNENNTAGPIISGITTFSGQNFFVPPKGTTAERPSNCPPGSIRFNTDSAKLEYFDSLQWLELEAFNVEIGISTNAAGTSGGLGHRGVFFGGGYGGSPTPSYNIIDYVTISTIGNALDFGDLTQTISTTGATASSTRGLRYGGFIGGGTSSNVIDYVTIASTGNAQDFGDTYPNGVQSSIGLSNGTRALFGGGWSPSRNAISYVTISSTGNALYFGDLTQSRANSAAFASSTRGIWAAGGLVAPALAASNVIDYVTIATTGNAVDFGDTITTLYASGCSNSTRGIISWCSSGSNSIEFITIASLGNAQDFGDQTVANRFLSGACSSSTRGIFGGGDTATTGNIIEYITISTTGNAQDFGDLTQGRFRLSACSNGHGGL